MTTTATPALSLTPFKLSEYFRDHAPATARRGLRGYILRVLLDMTRLRGPNFGMCWPSVEYLADMTGRCARTVQRVMRELEATGEVERIPQRRKDGGYSSNLYRLKGLISWARKMSPPPGDKRATKTPYGKKSNPARGGSSVHGKTQAAPSRHAPASARADGPGYAGKGSTPLSGDPARPDAASGTNGAGNPLSGVLRDPVAPVAKWRALSPAQVEEARAGCDPVRWERLRLAAGIDGVTGDDLDAAAAHRWRADAILRGVQLVA